MNQSDSHRKAAFTAATKGPSPARRALLGLTVLFGITTAAELRSQTNVAADFAALTSGQAGNSTSKPGTPGTVVAFGRDAFPVLEDANGNQRSPMAAGRAGTATNSACGVAYSASGMFNTGNAVKSALYDNAVLWASRKTNRASVLVGLGPSFNTSFFTGLGYQVKSVTTSMSATNNDLTGCDVFVGDWYSAYTATPPSPGRTPIPTAMVCRTWRSTPSG